MENNLFEEDILKLPKYFTDLKGESQGRTPHGGWYQNELLPWIDSRSRFEKTCWLWDWNVPSRR